MPLDRAVIILERLWTAADSRRRRHESGGKSHLYESERIAIAAHAKDEMEALDLAIAALDPRKPRRLG